MKEKIKRYIKEIVIFLVIITVLANVISIYKSIELNKQPLNINEITLIDNEKYIFTRDKPLLIHFWASWCPTCKLEASNIDFISKKFEVVTIAVKSGSDDEVEEFLAANNLTFNVANDDSGFFAKKFNISVFPTTLIYDKDRNLIFSEVGYTSTVGLYLRMLWADL
ncbi:MAG: redoxin domain-containing protein [Sulfurimonas sp.]|nr:redoxin domain-containing protein [Sulfurimonas sp.]